MEKAAQYSYEFGPFRLDAAERFLSRDGQEIALPPKVFETLAVLVERGGHVVSKEELLEKVWPDSFVEESSLAQNVSQLRKALGDAGRPAKYIETIPKRGYRFVAPLKVVQQPAGDPAPAGSEPRGAAGREEEGVGEKAGDGQDRPPSRHKQVAGRWRAYGAPALLSGVVVLIAVAVGFYAWRARDVRQQAAGVRSLAIVPFKPLGGTGDDEFLGLGMADALIMRLGATDAFTVLPTSAVAKFTGREHDAREIGRRLGVEAVLDGTVQRAGNRVRVTATLLDLRDGRMLWSGKFDEPYTDIFALQDSLSEKVSAALEFRLARAPGQQPNKRFTQNTEANELYLMGVYFWNKRTPDGLSKAAEYFCQAVERDPNYALAYAGLSDTYMLIGSYGYPGMTMADAYEKAKAAAARAYELDDTLAEAHVALGSVKAYFDHDIPEAARFYRRAIELSPNSATARLRYGGLLIWESKLDEALEQMRRAYTLDPLSPTVNTNMSAYYLYARRPDDASHYARRALEVDPTFWRARVNLGEAFEQKGMHAEAEAEYQKLVAQEGVRLRGMQQLARFYASTGRNDEARKLLAQILQAAKPGGDEGRGDFAAAQIYVALGEREAAFERLERAAKTRSVAPYDLSFSRSLDPLRADPRFTALLGRVAPGR